MPILTLNNFLPCNATYLKFHDFSTLLIRIMRVNFFLEFRTIFLILGNFLDGGKKNSK